MQQWLFELLRKQSVTDGRTDARTDARTDNVKTVYPLQTKFAGGIKIAIIWSYMFAKLQIIDACWVSKPSVANKINDCTFLLRMLYSDFPVSWKTWYWFLLFFNCLISLYNASWLSCFKIALCLHFSVFWYPCLPFDRFPHCSISPLSPCLRTFEGWSSFLLETEAIFEAN